MANTGGFIMTKIPRLFCFSQVSKSLTRINFLAPSWRLYSLTKAETPIPIRNREIGTQVHSLARSNLSAVSSQRSLSTFKDDSFNGDVANSEERGHPNRRTLYVGSMNFLTDEDRLKVHFSQYGEIEKVRVLHKTTSKIPNNYAFIQFKTVQSLNKALEERHFVDSRWLEVRKHDHDANVERKIHIKDIPSSLSENEIKSYFSKFGHVDSVAIPLDVDKKKDYGFVAFSSEEAALKALAESSHNILGNVIKASTFIGKRKRVVPGKVVVDLLPDNVTLEDVKNYFEQFAPLTSIDMVFHRSSKVPKNFAFLAFQGESAAQNIIKENKKHYINDQLVVVQPMLSSAKVRALSREKKVFIEGIPLGKTEQDVCAFFSKFGEALHVHFIDNWAKHHGSQCGILRFRKKADVENVLEQSQIEMDGNVLTVRRLGYTAQTSQDYTPLYLEFRRKHRQNPTSSSDDPNVVHENVEHKAINRYPKLN